MTCLHENADHLMPGECLVNWNDIGRTREALVEQFRCLDCGAWLSLGPSNDDISRAEVMLAHDINEMARLWVDGPGRDAATDNLVEFWSER